MVYTKQENVDEPENDRKLFIGGLDHKTDDVALKNYFEQFGEIVDVVVMADPETKRSRGFGFVEFAKSYMIDAVQDKRPHRLDGRVIDTKRAVPKNELMEKSGKKLFVGGIIRGTEEEDILEVFSEFGEVSNVTIPIENDTKKQRGFAFVEFTDYENADRACERGFVLVKGRKCEIKKAMTRTQMGFSTANKPVRGGFPSDIEAGPEINERNRNAPYMKMQQDGPPHGMPTGWGGDLSWGQAPSPGFGGPWGGYGGGYPPFTPPAWTPGVASGWGATGQTASAGYQGWGSAATGWGGNPQAAMASAWNQSQGLGTDYGQSSGGGAVKPTYGTSAVAKPNPYSMPGSMPGYGDPYGAASADKTRGKPPRY